MLGRDLPRQASATTPPDPRQEARVIRGVQRALIAAVDSYGTLSPNALDSTFHWGRDLGDLGTVMPTDGFVALLDGQVPDQTGAGEAMIYGAVALSSGIVDAMVEVQTTGRVEAQTGPARPVTRVDIVLVRDFIDLLLAGCAREFGDFQARDWPLRLSLGEPLEERHRLPLTLEERDYHMWKLSLELGGGVKSGQIALTLPVIGRADAVAQAPKKLRKFTEAERQKWRVAWGAAIGEAIVSLEAILMRRKLPFVEVEGLSVGTVLPFTDATLTEIRLEDVTGRAVLRGRLGQKSGMRAVRLGKEITMRATGGLAPPPAAAPPPVDLPEIPTSLAMEAVLLPPGA